MYAVIFTAKARILDADYLTMARQLRERALRDFGCLDFVSVTEGDLEIAISYWHSLEQIKRWKQELSHLQAQQLGQQRWYASYKVEVVEVQRSYQWPGSQDAGIPTDTEKRD